MRDIVAEAPAVRTVSGIAAMSLIELSSRVADEQLKPRRKPD